jgi:membrane protease YdiL (CAAX protease family)
VRRRRIVVGATLAVGATLLGVTLAVHPGDRLFYALTLALAATWALGAVLAGPLPLGWVRGRSGRHRPVLAPILVGLAAVAVFTAGAPLVAQVPVLQSSLDEVLDHARLGSLPVLVLLTVATGVAEEMFFRGALFAAVPSRPVVVCTAIYTLTTVTTGNVMLVVAAALLGLLVGVQRQVTGGVLAPAMTHVTWSVGMLLILPPLMAALG